MAELKKIVGDDPELRDYYSDFMWESATMGNLKEDVLAHVAHRKGGKIQQSLKLIKLPRGDGFITDGRRTARIFCCNEIVIPTAVAPGNFPITPGNYPTTPSIPEPGTGILFFMGLLALSRKMR